MRDLIAIIVLGTCVLVGTVRHLFDTERLVEFRGQSAQIATTQTRAEAVKKLASADDEIGYISDVDESQSASFYGLQYGVLPSILVLSSVPNVVVCHINDLAKLQPLLAQHQLRIVSDLGGGVFILAHVVR